MTETPEGDGDFLSVGREYQIFAFHEILVKAAGKSAHPCGERF